MFAVSDVSPTVYVPVCDTPSPFGYGQFIASLKTPSMNSPTNAELLDTVLLVRFV
jgi:hypothetical protein